MLCRYPVKLVCYSRELDDINCNGHRQPKMLGFQPVLVMTLDNKFSAKLFSVVYGCKSYFIGFTGK